MSIVLGTKAVIWTTTLRHPAVLRVTKTALSPPIYNWSSYIDANGELLASYPFDTPANYLSVGQVTTGPNPEPSSDPAFTKAFYASVIIPGGVSPISTTFRLGEGTYTRPTIGVLTITADCDVIADMDDLGPDGWSETGFWNDQPNGTLTKIRLRLRSPATVSLAMEGNATPYTGTIGMAGDIFDNHLQCTAWAKAIQTGVTADGELNIGVTIGGVAGTYYTNGTTTPSHLNTSGEYSSGHVRAIANTGTAKSCKMAGSWALERAGDLSVAIRNADGTGITADITIPRHGDDTGDETVEATDGGYGEAIAHHAWTYSYTAQDSSGGELITPIAGNYTNWGDFGIGLDEAFAEVEQPPLPTDWGPYSYVHAHDTRLPIRTWWSNALASIAQEALHDTLLGYQAAYTLTAGELVANTSTPMGKWSTDAGAIELDATNSAILIKPPAGGCNLSRSIELAAAQYGYPTNPPPREAWAGYRWLTVGLVPVDPATGLDLTRTGDAVLVAVTQDPMVDLWTVPDEQTWDNEGLYVKYYNASTVRPASDTYIDIDLAHPSTPTSASDGGNPPCEGNYGVDAQPNVLSRYPQPTLDAAHGGVTNAKTLMLTLPGGVWWRLKGISLHHKTGVSPTINLLPAWNQWIRSLRIDQVDDEDLVKAKDWRRRMLLVQCEGLLGAEAFDINRHSQYSTDHHVFSFTPKTVDEVLLHLIDIQQLRIYGTTTNKGAIRSYPGWSVSVLPSGDRTDMDDWLMSIGVHLGGRGMTWTGADPLVWANRPITDTLIIHGLTDLIDWFGCCGDLFGLGGTTGALPMRAGTVLRGTGEGLGMPADTYNLNEVGEPTVIASASPDTEGHLRMVGGHAQTDHEVHKSTGLPAVIYNDAHTISWDYLAPGGTTPTACIEAPCWWHHRGIHWVLFNLQQAMLGVAYAVSLCARGAKAVSDGSSIRLYLAHDVDHLTWVQANMVDGIHPALSWVRNASDALVMLSVNSGQVEQRISRDDGRSFTMSIVATGSHPAICMSVQGGLNEFWVDGAAIKMRTLDGTGATYYGPVTVVASGVDDDAIAVDERLLNGRPTMVLLYRSGGSVTQIASGDGGRSWS